LKQHLQTGESRRRNKVRIYRDGQKLTAGRTHSLEATQGGTSKDMTRDQQGEVHSQTGDRTVRDKSGHRKKLTDRGALTTWRSCREGQVRTLKETDQARCTHSLETAQGGTSQDTKKNQQSEVNSLSKDRTGRDKSGH
jgi:hypothetical protein